MRARPVLTLLLAALVVLLTSPHRASGQVDTPPEDSSILLILDSSGSMAADDGTGRTKLAAAKEAVRTLVDRLPRGALVGLRVYGHRVPNTDRARGCRDTELIAPVGPLEPAEMKARIAGYRARGFTPIGLSLRLGSRDLPPTANRTIILVSDGIDTCAPPDPCQVARGLAGREIDLRIETVGFQVDAAARQQLQCIARATGASYTDAPDARRLAESLVEISLRALRIYETVGAPVQGGAVSQTAPLLAPGQYVDAISPREILWYGVSLGPGQSVSASATMVVQGERAGLGSTASLTVELVNPALEAVASQDSFGVGDQTGSVAVQGEPVGSDDEELQSPGTYYVSVSLQDPANFLPEAEYPLELVFQVSQSSPLPTASPMEAESPPGAESGETASGSEEEDGQLGPAVWILVSVLAGALGAVAGALAAGRLARRT